MTSGPLPQPAGPARAITTPVRFLLAGAFAAAVNFASRVVLSLFCPYAVAIVVAYGIGMTAAFLLNRRFVFRNPSSRLHRQVAWFVAVNILALLQTLGVSLLLAQQVLPALGVAWHTAEIAHGIGIAVPIVTSYFGHTHWTFR